MRVLRILPSRPGEFHPEPLTDPDWILSHHPARAIARRLPPSIERRAPPVDPLAQVNGDDPPPSLHAHYPASSLLRGSPPLSGALVLSASRLEPLAPFPLASPARFSRSVPEPDFRIELFQLTDSSNIHATALPQRGDERSADGMGSSLRTRAGAYEC